MELWTYCPEEVTFSLAGLETLEGIAEGTFIKCSIDIPPFSHKKFADGSITRVYRGTPTYAIDVTLMNASPSNPILTYLLLADKVTKMAKFPIQIKDNFGTSVFYSASAWIESPPDLNFGIDMEIRTWRFRAVQATVHYGDNTEISSKLDDFINGLLGASPELISKLGSF